MTDRELKRSLIESYVDFEAQWDTTGCWWRDNEIVSQLGPALAALHREAEPTCVLGVASRGLFLAGLVAIHLGVGVVEVKKGYPGVDLSNRYLVRNAPPDYQNRDLTLHVAEALLTERDRVLFVDDWIDTGAQALTAARLVEDAGAEWIGGSVIVDGTEWSVRRRLDIRCLLNVRELPDVEPSWMETT
jgi:adenine phosphoribosyltransferase